MKNMSRMCIALALMILAQSSLAARCDSEKLAPTSQAFASLGFDEIRLCDVIKEFSDSKINFHSLLIERRAQFIAEVYKTGRDESMYSLFATSRDFDANSLHDVRSITKSIVSLLWGIAQAAGKTPSLNTPVLELFPELEKLKVDGRQHITIAHLFTMSSGLQWREMGAYGAWDNDEIGLIWRSSQASYLFDRPLVSTPGARFNYNGGATAVLAHILSERVGMPLDEYARKNLFEPLGITNWEWQKDLHGRPSAYAGLRLSSRDLVKIGRMILDKGVWKGRQIVAEQWLRESMPPHVEAGNTPLGIGLKYGYHWWAGQTDLPSGVVQWSAGIGNGGQRLYLVPALDMVVVITAGDYNSRDIGGKVQQVFDAVIDSVSK